MEWTLNVQDKLMFITLAKKKTKKLRGQQPLDYNCLIQLKTNLNIIFKFYIQFLQKLLWNFENY